MFYSGLEGDWESREEERERLLADAYAALRDTERLRAVRRALFERTGLPSDFEAWRESLPPGERASAAEGQFLESDSYVANLLAY